MADIIVADIGVTIQLTVLNESGTAYDLSSASTKQLLLRKPTGTIVAKTASFVTDGTDGKLKYVTIANDIDVPGSWAVRAYVVTPSYTRKSSWAAIAVEE